MRAGPLTEAKGYYIRTHNGHAQITMLSEVEHGPGMVLVKSNKCRDGSVNDYYQCGCIINRPLKPGEYVAPRAPSSTGNTRRSRRDWLDELLSEMEE